MGNLSTSLLLLVVAIFILWLAATGRIRAIPAAWDIIVHGDSATTATAGGSTIPTLTPVSLPSLPGLPKLNPFVIS